MSKRIVVIGGSAAGPKTAAKAKRLDQSADVTILQKGAYMSMASCGYPYYVGGFFDDRNQLLCTPVGVVRDPVFYLKAKGITARAKTEVTAIDRGKKEITCQDLTENKTLTIPYDKLVIATGASPVIPPVPGHELDGITTLQSMEDADFLRKIADEKKVRKAVVVGGGLIGVETCEALRLAGIEITVIEMLPQLLTFLDWEMAKLLENHIRSKAANVITDNPVVEFLGENGTLSGVKLKSGTELPCELAVVAVGVKPNVALASSAGLETGSLGGIVVNEYMQTSDPDIYSVGDCIEVKNRITGKPVLAPYGDLANLEGRVAALNMMTDDKVAYPGTLQTGICKVFDYAAGSTGLSETHARKLGYDIATVLTAALDKPHFMGGMLLVTKMVADKATGKILGVQAVGPGDVSKRIAEAAVAIQGGLTVEDMTNADLPYAPPFSPAIDTLIMTAHALENVMKGRMVGISSVEFKKQVDAGKDMCVLDVRSPEEYEQMRLGVGEMLMPLGALRGRLDELPEDKNKEIVLYCKSSLRAYDAATVLVTKGWKNVKVLEGGIAAWPFAREK